jgi:hypothetical protein
MGKKFENSQVFKYIRMYTQMVLFDCIGYFTLN